MKCIQRHSATFGSVMFTCEGLAVKGGEPVKGDVTKRVEHMKPLKGFARSHDNPYGSLSRASSSPPP